VVVLARQHVSRLHRLPVGQARCQKTFVPFNNGIHPLEILRSKTSNFLYLLPISPQHQLLKKKKKQTQSILLHNQLTKKKTILPPHTLTQVPIPTQAVSSPPLPTRSPSPSYVPLRCPVSIKLFYDGFLNCRNTGLRCGLPFPHSPQQFFLSLKLFLYMNLLSSDCFIPYLFSLHDVSQELI